MCAYLGGVEVQVNSVSSIVRTSKQYVHQYTLFLIYFELLKSQIGENNFGDVYSREETQLMFKVQAIDQTTWVKDSSY